MAVKSVMPSNHLILCHPLLPPSIFPSNRVFSNESVLCIRWPKYWSFSFSISPSNEYSGLISFRMDWLDLLAVRGILKSLLQCHSSKSTNSSVFSFLYGPTLTSIHDYWLQAGPFQSASLLFALPEARDRWAPVEKFTTSPLFALGNGSNNRSRVNSQSLSPVNVSRE